MIYSPHGLIKRLNATVVTASDWKCLTVVVESSSIAEMCQNRTVQLLCHVWAQHLSECMKYFKLSQSLMPYH
jgi:hypothetical protein